MSGYDWLGAVVLALLVGGLAWLGWKHKDSLRTDAAKPDPFWDDDEMTRPPK